LAPDISPGVSVPPLPSPCRFFFFFFLGSTAGLVDNDFGIRRVDWQVGHLLSSMGSGKQKTKGSQKVVNSKTIIDLLLRQTEQTPPKSTIFP
jgi:hypothetical protein